MLLAELAALYRRRRTKVLLLILAAVPAGLAIAVYFSGGPAGGDGPTFLDQISRNGMFAALAGLTVTMPFFLPLTVAVVSGDTIAGEASLGTLRYVLARPSGRTRLLAVKAATVVVFCLSATVAVALGGLITGAILFPLGDVVTISGTTLSLPDGILRTFVAAATVAGSLLGLAAIGMFISTLTDTPVAAMATALGVVVLVAVLENLPQTRALHPWLFTHYWFSFGDLLRNPVRWGSILNDLQMQLAYAAVFSALAWARFTTKDVLS
jgi:ABC-2 type transport system permease protein